MRPLHGWGVGVAIDDDHLDAQPLQLDGDLLAELAAAKQHDPDGGVGQGRADLHGVVLIRRLPPLLWGPSFRRSGRRS